MARIINKAVQDARKENSSMVANVWQGIVSICSKTYAEWVVLSAACGNYVCYIWFHCVTFEFMFGCYMSLMANRSLVRRIKRI